MKKFVSSAGLHAAEPNLEPHEEEQRFEDQRRRADDERALRARERFEMMFQLEIQNARRQAGLCIMCGSRLNWSARLFRAAQHETCRRSCDGKKS